MTAGDAGSPLWVRSWRLWVAVALFVIWVVWFSVCLPSGFTLHIPFVSCKARFETTFILIADSLLFIWWANKRGEVGKRLTNVFFAVHTMILFGTVLVGGLLVLQSTPLHPTAWIPVAVFGGFLVFILVFAIFNQRKPS